MTIGDAVKVLNEHRYGDYETWQLTPGRGCWAGLVVAVAPKGVTDNWMSEGQAIDAAKKITELHRADKPTLADEVAAVLVDLDQYAEVFGNFDGVHSRCRDRLRAALAREKGE